jgi:hypothetical protein
VFLKTSHPTMPNLVLTNTETEDVIAYILSGKVLSFSFGPRPRSGYKSLQRATR